MKELKEKLEENPMNKEQLQKKFLDECVSETGQVKGPVYLFDWFWDNMNQPPKSAGVKTVIINKGNVWKGLYFDNTEQARNALKFHLPKRKFKEPVKNKLVCAHFGTAFVVTELTYFKDKDQ